MASYGLDQLRADIDAKYGAFVFDIPDQEPATFLPVMRLGKEKRAQVLVLSERIRGDDEPEAGTRGPNEDTTAPDPAAPDDGTAIIALDRVNDLIDAVRDIFRIVAKPDGSADRFFTALTDAGLDDDAAVLLELWERYSEVAMPGEASPSES